MAFDSGKYAESVKHFELAARVRPGVTAEHMAGLVRALLALNNIPLAEAALDRLKYHNPTSWEAAREEARVLGRKSKVHAARAEFDDARKLKDAARVVIVKYPGWDSQPYLASRTGPLFDEVGLTADAEAAFKKYMELTEHATSHVHLAVFYIRHKESEKAIALARTREKTAPVLVTAQILSGAVRAKRPDAATEAQIEAWLDEARGRAGGNSEVEGGLIGARAELLDAQGKYDEAIKEYERAMAKHKSDRVVNNLSMLMVLKDGKNTDEAIKLMTELIGVRGPQPGFLDTRAVAYILSGRGKEAIQDLKIAQVQSDRAVYHYHMGWALDLDREVAKSVGMLPAKELERAKELGITAADLHPLEKGRYTELLRKHLIVVNDP
ncbi:MAG: tetratricopeptide repeat protein [Planctomycetes bacterium]|nr:tetratricopeptide repeat protein [Planctomycetota bacterium]